MSYPTSKKQFTFGLIKRLFAASIFAASFSVCWSGLAYGQYHRNDSYGSQRGVDWTTEPSTFTHDRHGRRVDQYQQPVAPVTVPNNTFVRSGYRNFRSTLQAGSSADNYIRTEQWGNPVQPYGEFRFPNRPFSVPYPYWGPQPVPGVIPFGGYANPGFAGGAVPGFGGVNNFGFPGFDRNRFDATDPRFVPRTPSDEVPINPWVDGAHRTFGVEPPRSDEEFFYRSR